jgi:hypothetical protein
LFAALTVAGWREKRLPDTLRPRDPATHDPSLSREVNNLDIWPSPGQALGHEAAMAALWGGLAAEETANALRE